MDREATELEGWEVLQITETGRARAPGSGDKSSGVDGVGAGSERGIRSDYFAFGSLGQHEEEAGGEDREQGPLGSDDSSEIDPRSKPQSEVDAKGDWGCGGIEIVTGNSSVSGLELREDGSVQTNFGVFDGKNELGCGVDVTTEADFEGFGETEKIRTERENSIEFLLDSGGGDGHIMGIDEQKDLGSKDDAKRVNFEGTGMEGKNSGELVLDSSGDGLFLGKFDGFMGKDESNYADQSKTGDGSESRGAMECEGGDRLDSGSFVDEGVEFPSGGDGAEVNLGDDEKKEAVWYKLPLELLKFCVFKISPLWSVSIAAAVVGFIILKKRWYKINHKNRSVPLKVSTDKKKASQGMVRVARINEAFSVVKRVRIIRSLPGTAGVSPWPVIGLI